MTNATEVTLDKAGRVLIPPQLRKRLGWETGTKLVVEEAQGRLAIRPVLDAPNIVNKEGVLVIRGDVDVDWANLIQNDREERLNDLMSPSAQ